MQNGFLKRYGKQILIVLAVLSLVAAAFIGQMGKSTDVDSLLADIIPAGATTKLLAERPDQKNFLFEVSENGNLFGYVTFGQGKGYGGPLLVMVLWSKEGKCLDIQVPEHCDTPSYWSRLESQGFFQQFIGREYSGSFLLGVDIDSVSNTTRSAEGVNNGFLSGLYFMAANVESFSDVDMPDNPIQITWHTIAIVILLLLVVVIRMVPFLARISALRYVCLFIGFIVIGVLIHTPLSLSHLVVYLVGFSPDISTNLYIYVLVFAVLGLALIFGKNFYCFWICPFCAVQEGAHFLGANQIRPVTKRQLLLRHTRYVLLWLVLMVALLMRNPSFAVFEPWSTLFSPKTGVLEGWILVAVVIVIGLFVYNFWCHYICPVGAVMDIVLKVRRWFVGLLKKTV